MSAKTCGEICLLTEDLPAFIGSPIWRLLCWVTAAVLKMEMLPCFDFSELLVSVSCLTNYFAITKCFLLSDDCKWSVWLGKESFSSTRCMV